MLDESYILFLPRYKPFPLLFLYNYFLGVFPCDGSLLWLFVVAVASLLSILVSHGATFPCHDVSLSRISFDLPIINFLHVFPYHVLIYGYLRPLGRGQDQTCLRLHGTLPSTHIPSPQGAVVLCCQDLRNRTIPFPSIITYVSPSTLPGNVMETSQPHTTHTAECPSTPYSALASTRRGPAKNGGGQHNAANGLAAGRSQHGRHRRATHEKEKPEKPTSNARRSRIQARQEPYMHGWAHFRANSWYDLQTEDTEGTECIGRWV